MRENRAQVKSEKSQKYIRLYVAELYSLSSDLRLNIKEQRLNIKQESISN